VVAVGRKGAVGVVEAVGEFDDDGTGERKKLNKVPLIRDSR
jgi:hypothetical protein